MLPPKKSTAKKTNPARKYKKPSSGDSLVEDVFEIFDPTGISSYDDVYRSYQKNGLLSLETGLEVLGALPIIGKAGKAIKGVRTANKYIKALNKVNKVVAKTEKVVPTILKGGTTFGKAAQKVSKGGKANPIAAASIVVGEGAKVFEKGIKVVEKGTSKAVKKVIAKAPRKQDAINTTAATLNTINTLSDVAGATQSQIVEPIIQKQEDKEYQLIPKKVIYYNTDPERGPVEKPGTESNTSYTPITNSAQLKKWKEQQLAYGTGEKGIGDPPTRLTFENELMSRVIAERNKDKNFVQRALNPSDYPVIINEDGSETTHLMQYSTDENNVAYVAPTVIQNDLGLLEKLPPRQAVKYGRQSGEEIRIPDIQLAEYFTENGLIKHAYGTNSQGIMKRKMNPNKKYANGSDAKGVNPSNYIVSPAEAVNDYNIMLAKAEAKANSNPWLPIVSIVGGLAQSALSLGKAKSGGKDTGGEDIDIDASTDLDGAVAAMGMNNVQQDVEVEGGEMYETPQGQVGEFQGPAHEQGGIPLEVGQDVEEGTKVYSDRLKVGKKTLAERKATREKQIANLEKIASDNLADEAVKNAAKRKMMAIEKEEAADLDFQDKVNNMQAMADTMVEAFACGTGMKGIQKYPWGTPPTGIKYGKGYDESMFKDFFAKYNELNPGGVMDMNYIQGDLGMDPKTGGFGKVFGPGTYKASQDWLAANKDKKPDPYVMGDANEDGVQDTLGNNPNINLEALQNFKIGEGINDNASLSYGDPYAKDGVNFEMPTETIMTPVSAYGQGVDTGIETEVDKPGTAVGRLVGKAGDAVEKMGGMPSLGDMTKLFGNYLGMTAGIKTAAEQRSTDVTHRNEFANAGKESQKLLDNAKQGIEISKAQAIVKATDVSRGGKRGGRNSARGVNQMRAMDWLYDTALQGQIAEISAKAAEQITGIDIQKSSVALNADQLRGEGQYKANMANEAAKDAYYTALSKGRNQFAEGLMQTGKDLNDMKENKIIEGLMKNYGTYFTGDRSGVKAKSYEELTKGKEDKKATTVSENLEVKIDTEGNEYVMIGGKKQLIKRK